MALVNLLRAGVAKNRKLTEKTKKLSGKAVNIRNCNIVSDKVVLCCIQYCALPLVRPLTLAM